MLDEESLFYSNDVAKTKINEDQFEYKKIQKDSIMTRYNPQTNQLLLSFTVQETNDEEHQEVKKLADLTNLDDFQESAYKRLLAEKSIHQSKKNTKSACIPSLVSQNRLRYKDEKFNLDLAYISTRVIAMGFPSTGFRSIYRNSLNQVLDFFQLHHHNRVKIYNMCDDKFIDKNKLVLNKQIKVSYFPMMDHNPAPIKIIFQFVLDAILYLAQDPQSSIAVHCKAGKGRTGVAVGAYLLFMEACTDAYDAIEFFNKRRTVDEKGLNVGSQKRYLHYFDRFIKSTFQAPFTQLVVPFVKNPQCFDFLFQPKNRMKLMTICLGPFKKNPQGMQLKLKLRNFNQANLFSKQKGNSQAFTQKNLYNQYTEKYFILLLLNEEIVATDDICISISTQKLKSPWNIKFRYWLNVRFVLDGVGKMQTYTFKEKENVELPQFVVKDENTQKFKLFDQYIEVQQQQSQSTGTSDDNNQALQMQQQTQSTKEITEMLRSSINTYEQNGIKKINAIKELTQMRSTQQAQSGTMKVVSNNKPLENSPLQKSKTTDYKKLKDNELVYKEEIKNDAEILRQDHSDLPSAVFSESEDELCIVKDENEEQGNTRNRFDKGSFRINLDNIQDFSSKIINKFNNSPVQKISERKKLPTFAGTASKYQINNEEDKEDIHLRIPKQNQQQPQHKYSQKNDQQRSSLLDSESVINQNNQNQGNPFQSQSAVSNYNQTANFEGDDQNDSKSYQMSEPDNSKQPVYSASDENEKESQHVQTLGNASNVEKGQADESTKVNLQQTSHSKNKLSLEISERINDLRQQFKPQQSESEIMKQLGSHLSLRAQQELVQGNKSYKKNNNNQKKLVQVVLSAVELDKFKEAKQNMDMKVMTTFLCDPQLDQLLLKTI